MLQLAPKRSVSWKPTGPPVSAHLHSIDSDVSRRGGWGPGLQTYLESMGLPSGKTDGSSIRFSFDGLSMKSLKSPYMLHKCLRTEFMRFGRLSGR